MEIKIYRTKDESIKIYFLDKIIYELEFFEDGDMVFCETDNDREIIKDLPDTKELFLYLNKIMTYKESLGLLRARVEKS